MSNLEGILNVYFSPELRRGEYWGLIVAILPSCQDMKTMHDDCIIMNILR